LWFKRAVGGGSTMQFISTSHTSRCSVVGLKEAMRRDLLYLFFALHVLGVMVLHRYKRLFCLCIITTSKKCPWASLLSKKLYLFLCSLLMPIYRLPLSRMKLNLLFSFLFFCLFFFSHFFHGNPKLMGLNHDNPN
jgi:hypothetical protein